MTKEKYLQLCKAEKVDGGYNTEIASGVYFITDEQAKKEALFISNSNIPEYNGEPGKNFISFLAKYVDLLGE